MTRGDGIDGTSNEQRVGITDYLVRVHVKKDGSLSWERVHMNYTKK